MIRLEDLTKRYGEQYAVRDLGLEVPDGEVCVLIGPSGCGKTTTLRMINRLLEPTSGRVLIDDVDTATRSPEELRRHIGYAIQSVGLFPHLSVAENIATVPRLLGWDRSRIRSRVEELVALVGLGSDYADKYPRQLSGGEAQRVGVARALAADPPVLLMDEPFGAVDPLNRERLQGEFQRIQRALRKTVVFVTHDIDEAIRLADRIAVMREGSLEQYASPEEILDRPANHFVKDFVGADRALKRLVREPVSRAMMPAVQSRMDELAGTSGETGPRFVYVTDADGRLVGWLDRQDRHPGEDLGSRVTHVDPREVSVREDADLKEALSRMLGLGFRSIPVTAGDGRLLGEVSLESIEAAMSEGQRDSKAGLS